MTLSRASVVEVVVVVVVAAAAAAAAVVVAAAAAVVVVVVVVVAAAAVENVLHPRTKGKQNYFGRGERDRALKDEKETRYLLVYVPVQPVPQRRRRRSAAHCCPRPSGKICSQASSVLLLLI